MDVSNRIIQGGKEIKINASEVMLGSKDNYKALSEIVDYVIEDGEKFRKWNSGKLEQWGTFQVPAVQASSYGSGHYVRHTDAFEFPISFISAPEVLLSIYDEGYFHAVSYYGTTQSSIGRVYLSSFASLNRACRISYKAIGRWK